MAIVICLLYVGASVTVANSTINQYIPLGILAILLVIMVVTVVALIQELREYWTNY
jgi:phage-related minor tail protein